MADANVAPLRARYDALNRGDVSEVMALIPDEITWDPGDFTPDRMQRRAAQPASRL
jgi:ketosteroid isomerase-like protein